MPLQLRTVVVEQTVGIFWESLGSDMYPDEAMEGCFGVQKDPVPRSRAVDASYPSATSRTASGRASS